MWVIRVKKVRVRVPTKSFASKNSQRNVYSHVQPFERVKPRYIFDVLPCEAVQQALEKQRSNTASGKKADTQINAGDVTRQHFHYAWVLK